MRAYAVSALNGLKCLGNNNTKLNSTEPLAFTKSSLFHISSQQHIILIWSKTSLALFYFVHLIFSCVNISLLLSSILFYLRLPLFFLLRLHSCLASPFSTPNTINYECAFNALEFHEYLNEM